MKEAATNKACVIGWPISHSRSPLIHNYWLKQLGLDGLYTREPVEPESLRTFFQSLRDGAFLGCNVTMPHKEEACRLVDDVDERVQRMGSLNTVWREAGKLRGTSTDGRGFLSSLASAQPRYVLGQQPVVILGAGGSVRAIIDEMLRQGVPRIFIYNRTASRADELVQLFGPKVQAIHSADLTDAFEQSGLLVNTVPATALEPAKLPLSRLKPDAVVADIIYTPLFTPLLDHARQLGLAVVPGLGMLLHQAVPGFEKWFGVTPRVTQELYDLVARDIYPNHQPGSAA